MRVFVWARGGPLLGVTAGAHPSPHHPVPFCTLTA